MADGLKLTIPEIDIPPSVNLLAFGADPTGTNDCAPAINQALTYLNGLTAGGQLVIPAGLFKINSQISYTYPNAQQSISIVGAGADATELYWPTTNGMMLSTQSPLNSLNMRDMAITTGTNTAIGIQYGFGYLNKTFPLYFLDSQSTFERVIFRGHGDNTGTFFWLGACEIVKSYVNFDSCQFYGYNSQGTGLTFGGASVQGNTSATTATTSNTLTFTAVPAGVSNNMFAIDNNSGALVGITHVVANTATTVQLSANVASTVNTGDTIVFMTYAVNINIDKCAFAGLNAGASILNGAQGITFTMNTFIEGNLGIFADNIVGVSEINVGSCNEFAVTEYAVAAIMGTGSHSDGLFVTGGNVFEASDGTGTFYAIYSSITNTIITGNNFEGVSGAKAIYIDSNGGIVGQNNFQFFGTAITLDTGAAGIFVGPNAFSSVTTQVTNNGGSNNEVGNTTTWLRGDMQWTSVTASAAPGGSNQSVQYSNGTAIVGDANLLWNYATASLGVGANVIVNTSCFFSGNSTVLYVSNSVEGIYIGGGTDVVVNSSALQITAVSSVATLTSSTMTVGNSTVFTTSNSTADECVGPVSNAISNSTAFQIVGNTTTLPTATLLSSNLVIGNSTITGAPQLVLQNTTSTATINVNMMTFGTSNLGTAAISNGFVVLPNKMIMMWGSLSASSTATTVTFSTATGGSFSVNCYSISATGSNLTSSTYVPVVTAVSKTSFTVGTSNATAKTVYWIAVGQ